MDKKAFQNSLMWHGGIIVVFFILSVIYFKPLTMGNFEMNQHDIKQWGSAAKEIKDFRESEGEEPLWTNSMFGGMPSYLVSTLYPNNLIKAVRGGLYSVLPNPANMIFYSMVCFYIMMICFNVKPIPAALAAIGYTFASFSLIGIWVGHNAKIRALAVAPLVLAGIQLALTNKEKKWLGIALTALAMAFEIEAGHYQITYYLFMIIGIYGVAQLVVHIKAGELKSFGITAAFLIGAVVLGVLPNIQKLAVVQEYSKFSTRGPSEITEMVDTGEKDAQGKPILEEKKPSTGGANVAALSKSYVFDWSQGTAENFTFLIPNFFGGASYEKFEKEGPVYDYLQNYFGGQTDGIIENQRFPTYRGTQGYVAAPMYLGAIMVFLFVLGLIIVEGRHKWWLAAAFILGLVLSMGENLSGFNYLMYDYFPMYNKFRTVAMAVWICQFSLAILAGFAIEQFFNMTNKEEQRKGLFIAGGVTAGLVVVLMLIPGSFAIESDKDMIGNYASGLFKGAPNAKQVAAGLVDAIQENRESMMIQDAKRSLLFIALAIGGLFLYHKKILANAGIIAGLLGVLVLVDLWTVDTRYLYDDSKEERGERDQIFEERGKGEYYSPNKADLDLMALALKDPNFRVLNINNPFNEARTSYFHKSIGGYHGAKLKRYQQLIERRIHGEMGGVVKELQSTGQVKGFYPALAMLNAKYFVYGDQYWPNKTLGNAWFVNSIEKVNSPDEEINAVSKQKFNPAASAVVDVSKFKDIKATYDGKGSINLTEYKANKLTYEYDSDADAFAVFSEVFYPKGWKLKVDGKPVDLVRANFVLRGAELPAGKHTVVMSFEPEVYNSGSALSLISSLVIMLGFVAAASHPLWKDKVGGKKKEGSNANSTDEG